MARSSTVFMSSMLQLTTRSMVSGTIKTNKSVAKRFKLKGNGQLKRMKGGKSHNTGYKKRGAVNKLATSTGIKEPKIEKRIRRMLGV
eukprot:CAMPEP_0196801434 /NCGR_PEP_ID=MMETSP1362-20130617/1190_1 /TAXON_ID=163516 /ORGANISM="Leptocylindrus danicus, Strain CCMP1856" /LENGTH=86 /DNA_ID=CAMNT_0042172391 /DNA_START=168 /DNA_END=428 /DNA_ORIENTATION=+